MVAFGRALAVILSAKIVLLILKDFEAKTPYKAFICNFIRK